MNTRPRIQLPVRLDPELFEELDTMSNQTFIPKSVLTRLAIKKLMNEMKNNRTPVLIQSMCEV